MGTWKWRTLRHNGVAFPEAYSPKGLTISIRGQEIQLNRDQEERVYAWAKKKDTPYVRDSVFKSNFLQVFKKLSGLEYETLQIEEIDFSQVNQHVDEEKNRVLTPEEKKAKAAQRKESRLKLKEKYGYAEIDGVKVEIANWMVEPPGLFLGRGQHPLRGSWKPRVESNHVTLNLDEAALKPTGEWGKIIHDHESMWLACWTDELTRKVKYVWPSDTANLRQKRDKAKYDEAARLEGNIERVRKYIADQLKAKDEHARKLATVCYLIDKLAMRVGDEKDTDEADTVGASTLRVEHIRLTKDDIEFDFLGKDSVRWQKKISLSEVDPSFACNLEAFMKGKQPNELLFDGLNSRRVNRFLNMSMENLTAKVFRTYHATNIVRVHLASNASKARHGSEHQKLYEAKMANLQAAIRCNHKRSPPKNWELSVLKKEEKLKLLMASTPKTPKQAERLKERIEKMQLNLELTKSTRDYNLNTSLRNYIDPRLYKAWATHVDLDWQKIYPATLQRKFKWAGKSRVTWAKISATVTSTLEDDNNK